MWSGVAVDDKEGAGGWTSAGNKVAINCLGIKLKPIWDLFY